MKDSELDWFAGVDEVVADPIKFKLFLSIGEDAYTSLRVKKAVVEAWDAFGAAGTAAAVAKSSVVASALFPSTGLLSAIGFGTAVTPVGWVVGAAVVAGGAWIGVTRYLQTHTEARIRVIPEFINTPLDVLGLALFDLIAPLALKVALIDGEIDAREREKIVHWLVRQWGYDTTFVQKGMAFFAERLEDIQIKDVATALAHYQRESPDCNYRLMTQEVLRLLREVMEADGVIDEREELAIERISLVFEELGRSQLGHKIFETAATAGSVVVDSAGRAMDATASKASRLGHVASDALKDTVQMGATGVTLVKAKLALWKRSDPQG